MKNLNLDALVENTRTLTLKGVVYEIPEMTVENFIATTSAYAVMEKKKDSTVSDQVEMTIALIKRSIPSIDVGVLREFSLDRLGLVAQFLRGELDGKGEEVTPEEAGVQVAGNVEEAQ